MSHLVAFMGYMFKKLLPSKKKCSKNFYNNLNKETCQLITPQLVDKF